MGVELSTLASAALALPLLFVLYSKSKRKETVKIPWCVPAEALVSWKPTKYLNNASIESHLADQSLLPSTGNPDQSFITCYAPASGAYLATMPSLSEAEISDKIRNAEIAQKEWKETTWEDRRQVLRTLLKWTVEEMEFISRISSRDTGKTLVDAAFGEVLVTAEKLRWVISNGEQALKDDYRSTNLLLAHKVAKVTYEPLGVVAAIVSWNYAFHNVISPVIAAIFAGNAIVVKPSENVAWSGNHFINAIRSALEICGHSPEVVQIATCLPNSVEALTGDTRIKHITFIGSEQIGQKVAIKGAEVGTPVVLELGGKDPCVILPDADIKFFTNTWMRSVFQAAGQNCIGVERMLVPATIYDEFVELMRTRVSQLKVGDNLTTSSKGRVDVGAMVTNRLFGRLESLIGSAAKQGARLLAGGKQYNHPDYPHGHYFEPTLIVDVTPEMEIAQTELFAPVMTLIKYETIDDAIKIANGTRYGLGASVFGRSKELCRQVGKRLECGMVSYNDFGVFYLNQGLPFGGVKSSGYGRFAGPEGLRGLCNPKVVIEDRLHGWIQTGIPPLLAYPISDGPKAWAFVSGLIGFMYPQSFSGAFSSLAKLVGIKQ